MRTVFISTLCATLLSACANIPSTSERLAAMQDWELCYLSIAASAYERDLAGKMVQSRRIDCAQYIPLIQTKIAADSARDASQQRALQQIQMGLQMMSPSPPPPPSFPSQIRCTSRTNSAGVVQTVCN
jgi:hypothetical protein